MRPPRWCAALALALAATSVAAAQQPSCPTQNPWPTPAGLPAPAPAYYVVPQPLPPSPGYSWLLFAEGGRLQVQAADGSRAACEGLTFQAPGEEPVEAGVEGKQVFVRTAPAKGAQDSLRGSADRVTRRGPDGAVVSLEGNAKLTFSLKGTKAEVTASRISVNLATGQVEVEGAGSTAPPPPPGVPATYQLRPSEPTPDWAAPATRPESR